MTDTPDLVVLLYRADWTRLSLAAEVSHTIDHDLDALRSGTGGPGTAALWGPPHGPRGPVAGSGRRARPTGNEWETATDLQGTETSRSTLLVAPGGRCRYQGDGFASGCDGDRSWQEFEEEGRLVEMTGGPRPPLATLLRPSWLLNGYTLAIGGSATTLGRDGLRVVATPRRGIRDAVAQWHRPVDRVEVIVDAELGILLRHEEIFDGKPLSRTELVSVSFNPVEAADDAQFRPPSGWEAAEKDAETQAPSGPGWELTKLATGLAARGVGAWFKSSRFDPFGQATREEPDAAMPEDEPMPSGGPVSDEVLHLLYESESRQAPGIEATLHSWFDYAGWLSKFPDEIRQAGIGGFGSLANAAGLRVPAEHEVSRLRISGPDKYRIDYELRAGKSSLKAISCDGQRRWRTLDEEVRVGPAEPAPLVSPLSQIANLFDPSWLLESRLTGGTETVIGGRRGYRLAVASHDPPAVASGYLWWQTMFSPDEVVLDAELGFLLCSISHAGPRVLMREELRDVITAVSGAPGDFQPDLPPGMPVVEEEPDPDAPPGPVNVPRALAGAFARKAAKDAQSAVQGFVDFIRGGDARLSQDNADDLVESTGLTVKAAIALTGGPRRRHRLRTIMCGELQGTTGANMDLDRRLDPEIAAALAELPIMDLSDIPAARETMLERRAVAAADAQPSPTVVRQDHLVPGLNGAPDVRVRHYRPIRAPGALPCLYWIHGGGHVLGQMDQDDLVMDHIVDSVGCAAVSVEWRRAPEHPFPAPMDDCYAGLAWTHKHAAELNVDPQRIAVGGASSGGGSAAGLVLLARDRGEFPVCFQLLIYPMLDDRNATPASMALTDPRVWNRTSNLIGWRAYVGDAAGTDRVSPYAAPARAANLAGLPPAYLAVGDLDLFIDEDIEYAQRLQQADVPTELHVYPGGSHAFESYAPGSALARRFVRDRDEALRRAFGF